MTYLLMFIAALFGAWLTAWIVMYFHDHIGKGKPDQHPEKCS